MTKSKILLTVLSVLLSCHFLLGQISTFEKVYDYEGSEEAFSVCQTSDGGFVMTGRQFINLGESKIFITKTDSLGNEEWYKIYGYPYGNFAYVVEEIDEGYLIGGYTTGHQPSVLESDAYLLRLDLDGDTLWTKRYGGVGQDYITDLKSTSDGGFIATGGYTEETNGVLDGYLRKLDNIGNIEWEQNYGGNENPFDVLSSVEIVGDTGYVFCGRYHFGVDTSAQVWLLRTDLSGEIIWSRTYGSPLYDFGQDVSLTGDGGYLVAGATAQYDPDLNYDTFLIRTNADGDTLWTHVLINFDRGSNVSAIRKLNDGGYILGIMNYSSDPTAEEMVELRKINEVGEIEWRKYFNDGQTSEFIRDVVPTTDGGYAFVGGTSGNCIGGCAWLVKTDETGDLVSISKPEAERLGLSIYPNPTNGLLKLDFSEDGITEFQLIVYDAQGKKIWMDELDAFSHHVVDLRNFIAGTYFLQLIGKNGTHISRKILLQTN